MQIAVISDGGEVIDSVDVIEDDMRVVLDGPQPQRAVARSLLIDCLDTEPVRRFVGLPAGRRAG